MKKASFIFSLMMLFCYICNTAKAQATYYNVYLCGGGSVSLHPANSAQLVNGATVFWYLDGNTVAVDSKTYNGGNTADYVTPTSLSVGAHTYTSRLQSAGGCLSDPSDPFTVYILPNKTLTLGLPSNTSYCDDATGINGTSTITATTAPAQALPAGVKYTYVWSAKKDGAAVTSLSTVGSDDASNSATNTFTVNTTAHGAYEVNATVSYALDAANTGQLRPANGCATSATATQTVTVGQRPAKPTIQLL